MAIWQCRVKPTTLRALNMGPPEVVARVLRDRTDPLLTRPMNPLCGKSRDGTFKTAAAKEYPSLLCRSLVIAALSSIRYRLETVGRIVSSPLSPEEHDWLQQSYSN